MCGVASVRVDASQSIRYDPAANKNSLHKQKSLKLEVEKIHLLRRKTMKNVLVAMETNVICEV